VNQGLQQGAFESFGHQLPSQYKLSQDGGRWQLLHIAIALPAYCCFTICSATSTYHNKPNTRKNKGMHSQVQHEPISMLLVLCSNLAASCALHTTLHQQVRFEKAPHLAKSMHTLLQRPWQERAVSESAIGLMGGSC
jgi:hypothetical protein